MEIVLGNRGLCAQPCRLPYELCDSNDTVLNKGYLLSPKDLNSTTYLPELIKAGVNCFKIEGRMKTPEYVAEVTRYYRKYIDIVCDNIELENEKILKIIEKELSKQNECTKMTDKEELTQVFNRGGFSDGHLPNNENRNLIYKEKSNNIGFYIGKIQKINSNKGHLFIELKNPLNIGDRIGIGNNSYTISELMINGENVKNAESGTLVEIGRMRGELNLNDNVYKIESRPLSQVLSQTFENGKEFKKIPITATINIQENKYISIEVAGTPGNIYEGISYRIASTYKPEIATNSPITIERVKSQISKTGNTQFEFSDITINLDDGLFVPKISILNDLRRNALTGLEQMAIRKSTRTINSTTITVPEIAKTVNKPSISLLLNIINKKADYTKLKNIERLYIPLRFFVDKNYEEILTSLTTIYKVYLYMPTVLRDNKKLNIPNLLNKYQIKGVVISNSSQIKFFKSLPLIGNYNLNIYNQFSAEKLKYFKLEKYTISPELNKQEVIDLVEKTLIPSELIVYGKIPLMTNNYCYLSQSNKCFKDCTRLCIKETQYYLKDRMGFKFRIIPDPTNNITTVFNSKTTSIKYDKLKVNSVRIDILDESVDEIQNIINTVNKCERFEGKDFTNGKIK